jgi:K+-transporting ATPase A subunit
MLYVSNDCQSSACGGVRVSMFMLAASPLNVWLYVQHERKMHSFGNFYTDFCACYCAVVLLCTLIRNVMNVCSCMLVPQLYQVWRVHVYS